MNCVVGAIGCETFTAVANWKQIFCLESYFRKCYSTILSILITDLIQRHALLKSNEKKLRLFIMRLHQSGNKQKYEIVTKFSSLKNEPTNLTLPDSNRSEWFFWTFLIDQSTSSGMWSIPTTWPCLPTYKTNSFYLGLYNNLSYCYYSNFKMLSNMQQELQETFYSNV